MFLFFHKCELLCSYVHFSVLPFTEYHSIHIIAVTWEVTGWCRWHHSIVPVFFISEFLSQLIWVEAHTNFSEDSISQKLVHIALWLKSWVIQSEFFKFHLFEVMLDFIAFIIRCVQALSRLRLSSWVTALWVLLGYGSASHTSTRQLTLIEIIRVVAILIEWGIPWHS